jgi:hypothetical protein
MLSAVKAVFLVFLSLISKHVMLRMMVVMDDVSLITISHQLYQMQNLEKD